MDVSADFAAAAIQRLQATMHLRDRSKTGGEQGHILSLFSLNRPSEGHLQASSSISGVSSPERLPCKSPCLATLALEVHDPALLSRKEDALTSGSQVLRTKGLGGALQLSLTHS